jgi:hypothetical protein
MNHIDHEATIVKAEQAIERNWIHGETRQALKRYLSQIK